MYIVLASCRHHGSIVQKNFFFATNRIIEPSCWHCGSIVFVCMLHGIILVRKHNRLVTCGGDDLALVWFCVQTLLQVHFSVVHLVLLDSLGVPSL